MMGESYTKEVISYHDFSFATLDFIAHYLHQISGFSSIVSTTTVDPYNTSMSIYAILNFEGNILWIYELYYQYMKPKKRDYFSISRC